MSTVIQCPHCQARMRITRLSSNGRYRCVKCRRTFQDGKTTESRSSAMRNAQPEPARQTAVRRVATPPASSPAELGFCSRCRVEVIIPPDMKLHEAACPECSRPLAPAARADKASPASSSQDEPSSTIVGISRISTWWVYVMSTITFGFYNLIWFFHNAEALSRANSRARLDTKLIKIPLIAFFTSSVYRYLITTIYFILYLFLGGEDAKSQRASEALAVIYAMLEMIWTFMALISAIIYLVCVVILAFQARRILQDHYWQVLGRRDAFSGFLTFLLNCIYLQYKINDLERER